MATVPNGQDRDDARPRYRPGTLAGLGAGACSRMRRHPTATSRLAADRPSHGFRTGQTRPTPTCETPVAREPFAADSGQACRTSSRPTSIIEPSRGREAAAPQGGSWQGNGDVVIELGPPQIGGSARAREQRPTPGRRRIAGAVPGAGAERKPPAATSCARSAGLLRARPARVRGQTRRQSRGTTASRSRKASRRPVFAIDDFARRRITRLAVQLGLAGRQRSRRPPTSAAAPRAPTNPSSAAAIATHCRATVIRPSGTITATPRWRLSC